MSKLGKLEGLDDEEDEVARMSRRNRTSNNPENPGNQNQGPNWGNLFTTAVGLGAAALGAYGLYKASSMNNEEEIPNLVEDQDQLKKKLAKLRNDTSSYPVVGFNCQWTNRGGRDRSKVKLIQIASVKGEILLIQMDKFHFNIPQELKAFLGDPNVIKTGIEVDRDASYLFDDYGLQVYSTYDLRFLAEETGHRPEGLAGLAGKILDLHIDEVYLDWDVLDEQRIRYAETTAIASIDIFKQLFSYLSVKPTKNAIIHQCYDNFNKKYVFKSQEWPVGSGRQYPILSTD